LELLPEVRPVRLGRTGAEVAVNHLAPSKIPGVAPEWPVT